MTDIIRFFHDHRPFFDAVQMASSVVSLFGWLLSFALLLLAWSRGWITSLSLFGMNVTLAQKEATVAMSRAARVRASKDTSRQPGERSQPTADLAKLNAILERAFSAEDQANLIGKAILWVDDNPSNNDSEVLALRKIGLAVDLVDSTSAALDALAKRPYDMVISDMGRGAEKFAGYALLQAIRAHQNPVPFIVYSAEGSKDEHRKAAIQRSALGSTDYPHELLDLIVSRLGEPGSSTPTGTTVSVQ